MVQETFLRAFRLLPTLERRESFGSFLAGIAVRVCADFRKARARSEVSIDAIAEPTEKTETARETDDRLITALRALPEIHRDALALFYFADRSYREIAATLGISEAAVNARLAVARRLLRDFLGEGAS